MIMLYNIMKLNYAGAAAVMFAAILWSLDGTFLRPYLYSIPVELVVLIEHGLGLLLFLPFLRKGREQIRVLPTIHRGSLVWIAVCGGILGTVFITKAFFLAYAGAASLAMVILLQKLQPIFALLMARILLKERLERKFYGRAGLALSAGYMLAFGFQIPEISGNGIEQASVFAFIAAFAYGSSTVMGKDVVQYLSPYQSAGMRFLLVTCMLLMYVSSSGGFSSVPQITGVQRGVLCIIVMTSGAVSMALYYRGLQRITASQATLLELVYPLSAICFDWWLHKTLLTPIQVGASVVMLFALWHIAYISKV